MEFLVNTLFYQDTKLDYKIGHAPQRSRELASTWPARPICDHSSPLRCHRRSAARSSFLAVSRVCKNAAGTQGESSARSCSDCMTKLLQVPLLKCALECKPAVQVALLFVLWLGFPHHQLWTTWLEVAEGLVPYPALLNADPYALNPCRGLGGHGAAYDKQLLFSLYTTLPSARKSPSPGSIPLFHEMPQEVDGGLIVRHLPNFFTSWHPVPGF